MTTTSTKSLFTLAAAAVVLTMAAAAPVQARGGDLFDRKSRGISHSHKSADQGSARYTSGGQTASDSRLFSDAQSATVLAYDLEPSDNGIPRRKWTRD